MTDFRALCAELLLALEGEGYTHWTHSPDEDDLVLRARAALAEPKPPCHYIYNPSQIAECGGPCEQGPKHCDCGELWMVEPEPAVPEGREPASVTEQPSNADLLKLAQQYSVVYLLSDGSAFHPFQEGYDMRNDVLNFARAVLARWGNPAPQHVPISERLPEPKDCDAEGRCWIHMPDMGTDPSWRLVHPRHIGRYHTHWIPAHALPLPIDNG